MSNVSFSINPSNGPIVIAAGSDATPARLAAAKVVQAALNQLLGLAAPAVATAGGTRSVTTVLIGPHDPVGKVFVEYGTVASKLRLVETLRGTIDGITPIQLDELHETSTIGQIVSLVESRLQTTPHLYRCTFAERTHYYAQFMPKCTYDGSAVVSAQ